MEGRERREVGGRGGGQIKYLCMYMPCQLSQIGLLMLSNLQSVLFRASCVVLLCLSKHLLE